MQSIHRYLAGFLLGTILLTSLPPTTYAQVSVPTMSSLVSSLQALLERLRGTQKAQVIATTGLVAAYNFNEGSGTTITDVSGNGRTGTFSGTPDWGAGKNGGSLIWGSGDNTDLGSQLPIQGVQQLTLSAWMKRASANSAVEIGKQAGNGGDTIALEMWTDGLFYFGLSGSDGYAGGSTPLNDTAWHHVTLVYDGTQSGNTNRLRGYVDGQLVTLSYTGTIPAQTTVATNPFGIGYLNGVYSNGQIDDVRVYTRILTQAEIQTDMNTALSGGGTVTTPPPTTGAPVVSLVASPTSITSGQSSTLSWTTLNATSCTASGGWTGTKATSGTQSVSPTANTTYTLTCTGAGGSTSQGVTVGVSTVTTPPTSTPASIANLQPGQWLELPNTKIRSVLPATPQLGYAPYLIEAWNGGTVDTARNRLLIWGGGHGDYYGNEMYALDLPTLSMKRILEPSPYTAQSNCTTALADGTPTSRHTYFGLAYIAHADKFFSVNGSLSPCGDGDAATWTYDFPTAKWQLMMSNSPMATTHGTMAVYDPSTRLVYVKDQYDFHSYSPETNRYTKLNTSQQYVDYHMTAAIDTKRRKFVMIGDGVKVIDLATNQMTTMSTTNAPSFVNSQNSPGVGYDPALDRIVAWHGGSSVYALNMDTGVWSQIATGTGPTFTPPGNGTYGRWAYVPNYGVFVIVNGIDQNAWVFKASSGTTTPPPTTSAPVVSLIASPTSVTTGGATTLSWVSTNATSCTASGGWTGTKATSGTQSVSPIANTTYTLSCTGAGGTATQSVFVTVTAPVSTKFTLSDRVQVSSGPLNVRNTANTTGTLLGTQSTGALGTIVGGPTAQGGFNWWQINYDAGVDGWSAEDYLEKYVVTTPTPTSTNPIPVGSTVTTFSLTSPQSGTLPFTVGLGFKKGDVTGTPALNVADQQVIVMRRWNDGSVKHAIASGHVALTANAPKTISVLNSTASVASSLTSADIQAANPQAAVQLGSIGTVSLSSLLATPFRTFISGPEMVEVHYRSTVGNDPLLVVWFHVRYYKNGRTWVRAIVENGYLDKTNTNKSYVPTVTVGGSSVYTNGGAALTHYAHTRWNVDAWIGGDPQITPKHDTAYLMASRLVPNYWKNSAAATSLNSLTQTYSPMQQGDWETDMGSPGFQAQIGLLPQWDALYLSSGGDPRAYRAMVANSKSINSYPIIWNDSNTKLPVQPSLRPNWTLEGTSGGGSNGWGAGSLVWEGAHHPSSGFLAYLTTGDYYYLEAVQNTAAMCYLTGSTGYGGGTGLNKIMLSQTRRVAWCLRSFGQLAGIAPSTDAVGGEYATLLANNYAHWNSVKNTAGINQLGIVYDYDFNGYNVGQSAVAPWQHFFWIQTNGYVSDLEPLSNMTTLNSVRDWMYRFSVGTLGGGSSSEYCYADAAEYLMKVGAAGTDEIGLYDSFGEVYQATVGANTNCGTSLRGSSGGAVNLASTGYWGNLLPAIAYAVEDGAPGAATSWARLTGASNWSTLENSGFETVPNWGIVPRSVVTTTPPPTTSAPVLSLIASPTSVTTGGATTLSWVSTNATSCTASGGWTGTKATSGTESVSPTANTTYTLTCTGAGGSVSQSVIVTVSAATTANSYYIRDGGTSTTCTDWANACDMLPATLVRGATYYIADGTYNNYYEFDDAALGNTPITIKKATAADHGTNTGWQASYGDGKAVVDARWAFKRPYYVIDGAVRNEGNWKDSASYGFTISEVHASRLDGGHSPSTECSADNITIRNVHIGNSGTTYAARGGQIYISGFGGGAVACENWTVSKVLAQNVDIGIQCAGCKGLTVEDSYFYIGWAKEAIRGQVHASNMTVRNTIFEDSCQKDPNDPTSGCTAEIALWDGDTTGDFDNNRIYNNVFFKKTTEPNSGGVIVIGGDGTGWVGVPANNTLIYGNTLAGFKQMQAGIIVNGSNNTCRNNLWYDIGAQGGGSARCTTSSNNVLVTTNPFLNYAVGDFRLSGPTVAGTALTAPYNTDASGATRGADGVWDIGAYEYTASGGTTTPPPVDTTAPTAPGTPLVTPLSASSLGLTWSASSDATGVTGYRVERCQGSSCTTYTQVATPTGTTYTDTGLSANTVYRYRVRATDAAGNLSTYSTAGQGTTNSVLDTTAPTVPGTPTITAPSLGTLSLTWAASTDAASGLARYRVERCQGTSCTGYTEVGTPTTAAFVNTGLQNSTTYRYRVRAEDLSGNLSPYTTAVALSTLAAPVTDTIAPTLTNVLASGSANAAVISATTNEPARLRVDYGLTATALTSSVSTTTLTTAHALTLPALTRRTTYFYRVTVTDQAGNSTQSAILSFTTGKGKTAPLKNLNAVYGSVILSWGVLEDPFAKTIAIHRTTNGTFPAVTDTASRLVTLTDLSVRSYRDTTARDGTTYSYTLYVIDDEGTASDPVMITFTPKAPTTSSGGGGGGGGGGSSKKPTPKPTPTPTTPTTPVVTVPTIPTTPATITTPAFTQPLFVGSQNAEVLRLQQFLIKQGFLASDSATGLYGPATEAAVKQYQCARNIVCTGTGASTGYGLVGNATRTQLNQEVPGVVTTTTTTTPGQLTPEARQALIQSLLQQVAILIARLQAMRGY